MSTIVVVRKNRFAAIAADTLSSGDRKDTVEYVLNHQNILRIGDSYIAVSGPTSTKLALKDYFAKSDDSEFSDVDDIYRTWLPFIRR